MADHWSPPRGNSSQFGTERPNTITSDASTDDHIVPNSGASVLDSVAIGQPAEAISSWQARNGIDAAQQIRIVKASHMRYAHPDLPTIKRFLRDFGMQIVGEAADRVWFGGYGPDPYVYYAECGEKKFLGGAFVVESMQDLERAAALPNASPIHELDDAPGGGHMVTVHDPEGFPVNLVFGQQPASIGNLPEKIVLNDGVDKPRVRKFHRFTAGPAAVHKLGHYGYTTQKFDEQVQFYTRFFNLVPSDFLHVPFSAPHEPGIKMSGAKPTEKDVAVFLHIDRGPDPVDHHTLFMASGPGSHVHHASFEVHDFDTQNLGHQWLAKQGYTSVWGVGRHILGSQIFDYWWDTTGNMIEHYADGDLVNNETPIGRMNAGDESLAVWGPEVPSWFLD